MYINAEEPAPCAGTVYGWRYCSYSASGTLQAQLAMYRSAGEDSYHLVDGSHYQLTVEDGIDSYTCHDKFLEPSEQFSILQGDMVAACWNNSNRVRLYGRRFGRQLISGGQCSQETIDGPSDVRRRTLLLSVYISK